MAREEAREGVVGEGEVERVALDEPRVRDAHGHDLEHRGALIEADDLAEQVPQATSSVRAGGSAAIVFSSRRSSSSQPGRSPSAKRPVPRYQSPYSPARDS